jgi:hypothetical protein
MPLAHPTHHCDKVVVVGGRAKWNFDDRPLSKEASSLVLVQPANARSANSNNIRIPRR